MIQLKKKLNSFRSGFSLVSTMVSLGILGFLSVVAIKLLSEQEKSRQTIQTNYEVDLLHTEVMKKFRDPFFCSAIFTGRNIPTTLTSTEFNSIDPLNKHFYEGKFNGFNRYTTKVTLDQIEVFDPTGDVSTLNATPSLAQLPGSPTENGWETIVIFRYLKTGIPMGANTAIRYERMTFNNYLSLLVQATNETRALEKCRKGAPPNNWTYIKDSYSYPISIPTKSSIPFVNFYECSIRKADMPVFFCY